MKISGSKTPEIFFLLLKKFFTSNNVMAMPDLPASAATAGFTVEERCFVNRSGVKGP